MVFDEKTVNGMRVLAAIVDSGSFVGAGELLGMSQSGVSRALARLEQRLRIRLFDRSTRRVSLTDEGRRFYAQVQPLLAGLEDAVAAAGAGALQVRGRLRVNVDMYVSRAILGPHLGDFLARYPELELDLVTRDQLGDMIGEGYDLAIRFGHPASSSLVARKLLDTRVLTVAAPANLQRRGRPAHPSELARHDCIQFRDPRTGQPFDWEFHRGGDKLVAATAQRLILNDAATLLNVLLAGHGLAQVLELAVAPLLASGQLVAVLDDWPDERFPLYALYPSRQHPAAKTAAFLDFVAGLLSQR
ncbi:LysR family transcriptional regulator [Oxalobacteraceae bacterium A2-2]